MARARQRFALHRPTPASALCAVSWCPRISCPAARESVCSLERWCARAQCPSCAHSLIPNTELPTPESNSPSSHTNRRAMFGTRRQAISACVSPTHLYASTSTCGEGALNPGRISSQVRRPRSHRFPRVSDPGFTVLIQYRWPEPGSDSHCIDQHPQALCAPSVGARA